MSVSTHPLARLAATVAVAIACGAVPASAQFGPFTSGPGGQSGAPPSHVPEVAPGLYEFGSPTNRVEVSYATGAGSFEKVLDIAPDPNGDGATDLADLSLLLAQPLSLNEYLTVGPGRGWTDWHETILTPDWEWAGESLTTPNLPGGPTGLTTVSSGSQVDFYFDELSPGTEIDIQKGLVFTGDPSTFTQQFFDDWSMGEFRIRVAEYPTSVPEPSTAVAALLAVCSASVVGLRTRLG